MITEALQSIFFNPLFDLTGSIHNLTSIFFIKSQHPEAADNIYTYNYIRNNCILAFANDPYVKGTDPLRDSSIFNTFFHKTKKVVEYSLNYAFPKFMELKDVCNPELKEALRLDIRTIPSNGEFLKKE